MAKSLEEMSKEIETVNREKGWYDSARSIGDEIALLHSEVSEVFEAWRSHGMYRVTEEGGKPIDVASECADVLIRLLDFTSRHRIDLESEYERKIAYNRTRPHRHGGKLL